MGSHSVSCHPIQVNTSRLNLSQRQILDLLTPKGWKAELIQVTGNILRWLTRTQTVTHLSTKPAAHGRESNSRPVDHKSDVLTTTDTTDRYSETFGRLFST